MAATTRSNVQQHFNPLSDAYQDDPYPLYETLRAETPAFYAPSIDMWVVTRAADIERIFRDPATFSAAIAQDPTFPLGEEAEAALRDGGFGAAPVMSNLDPPDHERIRKHNMRAFSVRRIGVLEGPVRQKATELIDAMVPEGRADFVAALSYPLPAAMIFRLIGFPDADTELLKSWTGNRLVFTWGRPRPDEEVQVAENMLRYWHYCEQFVARRLADPQDDFASDLLRVHLEQPGELSLSEVTNVCYGLSFAGHENPTSMTNNALRQLLSHREQWERLCADPASIPNAVEECLRFDSSNPAWRRITTREVSIGGVEVPSRAKLLLLLGAANHDPAWFDHPETFDIARADAKNHIAFGKGIHYCLGAALVRLELRIVLEYLTARLPSLRLVPGQKLHYTPNVAFRGPKELWVEWDQ